MTETKVLRKNERKIDYDRGVISRFVEDMGIEVFMYRKDPGVYYLASGSLAPESLAERAGFDVARFAQERKKATALRKFAEGLEADEAAFKPAHKEMVQDFDGFKVFSLGGGRHIVEDQDGTVLTQGRFLPGEQAVKLAQDMAAANRPVSGDGDGRGTSGASGRARKTAP